MQHKGIIVIKNQKKEVPDAFLQRVLEQYPSCYGAAFAHEGKLRMERHRGIMELQDLKSMLGDHLKDQTVAMFFGNFPPKFLEDDLQPTVLMGANDSPTMVSFVEGDFSLYEEPQSSHSDQFFFAQKVLVPHIQQFVELVNGDLDKVSGALQQDHTKRILLNGIENASVTILNNRGELNTHMVGDQGRKFDWGFASQHLNFTEKEYPEKKPQAKPTGMFAGFMGGKKEQQPPKTQAQPTVSAPKSDTPVVKAVDTDGTTDAASIQSSVLIPQTVYWASPPPEITKGSNKDVKAWYKRNSGSTPHNWKQFPKIQLMGKARRAAEVSWLNANGHALDVKLQVDTSVPVLNPSMVAPKDTVKQTSSEKPQKEVNKMTKPLQENKEKLVVASTEPLKTSVPIASANEKKAVEELVIKIVDSNSKTITDPANFQKLEEKYSTFTDTYPALKFGLRSLVGVEQSQFEQMCRKFPVSASQLLRQTLTEYWQLLPQELKDQVLKPEIEETKQEEVEQETAPPPRKVAAGGGFFSHFKK